jgi:tetratricopeptide (TPR) repeat protein
MDKIDSQWATARDAIARGDVAHSKGRFDEAQRFYRAAQNAMTRLRHLTGDEPEVLGYLSDVLIRLGDLARSVGNTAEAERYLRESYTLNQRHQEILGDTPDVLWSLGVSLCCLGDLAGETGNLAEAERYFRESHALNLRRQDILGDIPEVLFSLSSLLDRLGMLARLTGNMEEAERCFRESHGINLRRQEMVGDTPDVLEVLSLNLLRLGDIAFFSGNDTEAERLFRESLALSLRWQVMLPGDTPDTLMGNMVALQMRLGRVALSAGDIAQAERCFRESHALSLRRREMFGETPDILDGLGYSLLRLGDLLCGADKLTATKLCYRELHALNLRRREMFGDRPEVLEALFEGLRRLGTLSFKLGDATEAKRYFTEAHAVNLCRQEILGDTANVLVGLLTDSHMLGDLASNAGNWVEAMRHYQEEYVLTMRRREMLGDTPEVLFDQSDVLLRLGDVVFNAGDMNKAASCYLKGAECGLAIPARDSNFLETLPVFGERLMESVSYAPTHLAKVLLLLSRISQGLAEFLDIQDIQVYGRSRGEFARFHRLYFDFALRHAPEELPRILSAIQGRKLAALVLDELEMRKDEYPEGDARHRFLAVRTELRRLALGLKGIEGGHDGEDEFSPTDRRGRAEVLPGAYQAKLAEYEAKLEEYRELCLELSREPDFAAAAPHLDITHATLQSGLRPAEGLILILHVTPGPEDPEGLPTAYALVIRSERAPTLINLDRLTRAPALLRRIDAHLGRRGGYRKSGASVIEKLPLAEMELPDPSEAMEQLMREALWEALAPSIQGLSRLHLITHGDLHAVPVSVGYPVEEFFAWPGLIFYHLHKEAQPSSASPAAERVGILTYSADDLADETLKERYAPIPLVQAEGAMIQALWRQADNPLDFGQTTPVTCIHLAGHGSIQEHHLEEAHLLIGPDRVLTFHDVLGSPLRPQVVFISACLVGQTKEDSDGDPLGMVTAFMLRGARYVVAPVVPVSDFYMPLLAVLFHQGLVAGLSPPQALKTAKEQLKTGTWPDQTEPLFRASYTPVLARAVCASLAESQAKLEAQILVWLPQLEAESMVRRRLVLALAEAYKADPTAEHDLASPVLDWFVTNKASLPVREIITFTFGFGAG